MLLVSEFPPSERVLWRRRSASLAAPIRQRGQDRSARSAGYNYHHGIGVPQDLDTALKYID